MLINRTNDTVQAVFTQLGHKRWKKGASTLYGGVISSLLCERSRNGAIRGPVVRAVRYDTCAIRCGGTTKNCKKITAKTIAQREIF
jgi:hypothetical protein